MSKREAIYAAAVSAILLLIPMRSYKRITPLPSESHYTCMIPREDAAFMRNLVEKYADDINVEITVIPGDWPLDSLASGAVDLMIVPEETIDIPDNIAFSRAFADGTVWAVRASETEALRHINRWITDLTA